MAGPVVDIFMVYMFLKRLTTPFDKTEAFRLGLIDAEGKRLKAASTQEEKNAMGYFDRLVFNLKRLLATVPGGKTQLATFAAALLLLKEDARLVRDSKYLEEKFYDSFDSLDMELYQKFCDLQEEIANVTAGVSVGPQDIGVPFKRKRKSSLLLKRKQTNAK